MNRKKVIGGIAVSVVILFLVIAFFVQFRRTETCFYTNKGEFEKLSLCFKGLYTEGVTQIEFKDSADNFFFSFEDDDNLRDTSDEEEAFQQVKETLNRLRERYQKGSSYPVFSAVSVQYDDSGDMLLSMQVKKEKLKNGDGINVPDIRVYYLVYIDENYNGSSLIKETEPFYDNWYTWSSDTYSG